MKCKYCDSTAVVKYGVERGIQRYWCKICKRKFKPDDNLFRMKTPTNQITSALNLYYDGMSVKAIRRHLKQEYHNDPSTATIFEWIMKYTQYATDSIKDLKPQVGDVWVADETVIKMDGGNVWFWDIIDSKTRYLLATRFSRSRTTQDAQILIDRAIKTAGKNPQLVLTDSLNAYLDVNYGKGAEHRQGSPSSKEDSTNLIERFHGTLKARTKLMRGMDNIETAIDFMDGWLFHYNFIRPHESLRNKTPAQMAGIQYPYKNWASLIRRHKPSKTITIEHQPRDRVRIPLAQIGRKRTRRVPQKPKRYTPSLASVKQMRLL